MHKWSRLLSGPIFYAVLSAPFFLSWMAPPSLLAIHAIIHDAEPIPREHGPMYLGMSLPDFLKSVRSTEEKSAIGQFEDEHRYRIDPAVFPPEVDGVFCDFYNGVLFRIEINYKPVDNRASPVSELKEKWSARYGSPRTNTLPGTYLIFWDDGKTRLILEEDKEEDSIVYSTTYIDDAIFHQASRERVQKETRGMSSYGK